MRKILLILILSLLLSGCAPKLTEKEQAACDLIKEFVVFQSPDTEDVSWVDCILDDPAQYIPNDDRWVAISPKPSKEHPNYDTYIRNKKYREQQGIETPPTTLLIDPENGIVLDPNIGGQIKYMYFQKSGEEFIRPETEQIIEIYGSDIYGDILGE